MEWDRQYFICDFVPRFQIIGCIWPTIMLIGQLSALSQRTDPLNHCSGSMEEENVTLTEMEEDKIELSTYSEKSVFDIQTTSLTASHKRFSKTIAHLPSHNNQYPT
jgi:hypothetical protein